MKLPYSTFNFIGISLLQSFKNEISLKMPHINTNQVKLHQYLATTMKKLHELRHDFVYTIFHASRHRNCFLFSDVKRMLAEKNLATMKR